MLLLPSSMLPPPWILVFLLPVVYSGAQIQMIYTADLEDNASEVLLELSHGYSVSASEISDPHRNCSFGDQCECLKNRVDGWGGGPLVVFGNYSGCPALGSVPSNVFIVDLSEILDESLLPIGINGWTNVSAHIHNTMVVDTTTDEAVTTEAAKKDDDSTGMWVPIWVLALLVAGIFVAAGIAFGPCLFKRFKKWKQSKAKKSDSSTKDSSQKSKKDKKGTKNDKNKKEKEDKSKKSVDLEKGITASASAESVKSEKSEKSEKSGKSKSEKTGKAGKTGKSTKDKAAKTTKSEKSDKKSDSSKTEAKKSAEKTTESAKNSKKIKKSPDNSAENISDSDVAGLRSDIAGDIAIGPVEPPKRTGASKLTEPVNSAEFEYYLKVISKICSDYHDDPEMYNVTPNNKPGYIFQKIGPSAPEKPDEFSAICKDIKTTVMEGLTHWQHPRFHAYFPAGRSYPDILAEMVCATTGCPGFSWDACPAMTEMENVMVNWMGRALGIPEKFLFQESPELSTGGGVMLESASDGVFYSCLASRQLKIKQLAKKDVGRASAASKGVSYDLVTMHDIAAKLVYYTSKDAHSCMEKACKLAMVRCRPIQAEEKSDWGITGEQLEKEIIKDIEKGLIPAHVHVTLGTTSSAASDHLESIWPVASKYNMWIHVDAAYSGSCWIDPKLRTNCKGLEHANSINVNCHKMMLHSVSGSFFWTSDQKTYKDAFAITPVYLKPTHEGATDYRDWGLQLSRRFKALKTWFVMRMYGIEGLQHYVNHLIDMTAYFETLVRSHPYCRIFGKQNFSLFCFQYVEPGMSEDEINEATQKLCQYMNASHRIFFTHTKISKWNLIRVTVCYQKSTKATVDASWCVLQNLMEEFKNARQNNRLEDLRVGSPLPGHRKAILPGDFDYDLAGSENERTDVTEIATYAATSPRVRSPSMEPPVVKKSIL